MSINSKFLSDFKSIHDRYYQAFSIVMHEMRPEIETAESFLRKAVKSCDFCMCMPVDCFKQALKDNEIKEMSETGHGSTNGGIKVRRQAMRQLYSLDSTKYSLKDMPKYGLLVSKNRCGDLVQDPDVFYHYGVVMITFKKERIINRTTMTVGSSLQFDESILKTPTFVSDPKFICIKGMPKVENGARQRYFFGLKYFADHLIAVKKLSPDLPNRMADLAEGMPGFENFEIQIFGRLTFSDDVERIEYMTLSGNEKERLQRLQPLMDKYGLKCKFVFDRDKTKPFDKICTMKSDFGAEVSYGIFERDSDVFFILKTGNNGSLNGYMDKYLRIAANTAEKFGVNAIIATNPENHDDNYSKSKIDVDLQFVRRIASERNITNYKVYYMGYSNSARVAVCYAADYPKITRVLALNTMADNEDGMLEGINGFKGEKFILVHGTEDMYLPNIQALAMAADNNDVVKFVPVPDADHQFIGMLDEFMRINEMMF